MIITMRSPLRNSPAAIAVLILITPNAVSAAHKAVRARSRPSSYLVYIGTYTVPDSKGIYVYRFRAGRLARLGPDPLAAASENPSFLAVDPTHRFLYAVNETENSPGHPEQKNGSVSAFSIDRRTGRLKFLNMVPSGGAGPCFISLDRSGKHVLVANYASGSVATFPVLEGGLLGEASAVIQHTGHSASVERQEGPHAHQITVSPDNRFALAADLGLDKVLVYRFDAARGTLTPNDPPSASVTPGLGPRHFAFDPSGRVVYLLNEIESSVTTFSYDPAGGVLHEINTVPALPLGFAGQNSAAEIAVSRSGRFLYTSNRGEDAIVVFAIDSRHHTLKAIEHAPTLGKTPRSFGIDPSGR